MIRAGLLAWVRRRDLVCNLCALGRGMGRRVILPHHVLGSVPFSRIANAGFTIGGEDGPFSSWSSEEALSAMTTRKPSWESAFTELLFLSNEEVRTMDSSGGGGINPRARGMKSSCGSRWQGRMATREGSGASSAFISSYSSNDLSAAASSSALVKVQCFNTVIKVGFLGQVSAERPTGF